MASVTPAQGNSMAELRASRAKYPAHVRCRNPRCDEQVFFDEAKRGTKARVCSDRCRTEYNRSTRALRSDMANVLSALERVSPKGAVARELKTQLGHIRWLLAAHGAE